MRFVFSGGTAAELIKLFPVLARAERAGAPWRFLFTGQSPVGFRDQWADFRLPEGRLVSLRVQSEDLARAKDALVWFTRTVLRRKAAVARALGLTGDAAAPGTWIVHGDTLSTLAGAILGARLGYRVAHVEAGLRSGDLRDPFPEEIVRRAVGRIARLHFSPEPKATAALLAEKAKGRVLETAGNTQLDAIDEALSGPIPADMPEGDYALVNIHRFETLVSKARKESVRRTLRAAAERTRLIVVSHATTMEWLRHEGTFQRDLEARGTTWLPRQPFTRFAHWLARASHVVSDSGGNQEECAYLGVPCLLLRNVTERALPEGRRNVVLSRFDEDAIARFLADPAALREPKQVRTVLPSAQIWDALSDSATR
jgi:UDP-N-acetylglucosamine 2-epimerase (non-hydrolysing)